MALGVLSYPSMSKKDYGVIQEFRKYNDQLYFKMVEPHFAFVFPTDSFEEHEFVKEITEKARGVKSFNFDLKCACVNKDSFIEYFHLLLVPDQGHSNIVKLHDKLYNDLLIDDLRLDIDFIPHMGIANSKEGLKVKQWADLWNSRDFSIKGRVESLTVIHYDGKYLENIATIHLNEN